MPDFRILRSGPTAARLLAQDGHGRIAAVFTRTAYLELAGGLVALGARDLTMGPLNAATSAEAAGGWPRLGLQVGMAARLGRGRLKLGNASFALPPADLWRPDLTPKPRSAKALRTAVETLEALAECRAPRDGLASLFHRAAPSGLAGAVARRAGPEVERLEAWLGGGSGPAPEPPVARLLGLGPGLTPSGDDYLAGLMIALGSLGLSDRRDLLARVVMRLAPRRTTAVSRAHLSAAAEGLGAEALHALLAALLSEEPRDLTDVLGGLDGLGHSSGWDGAAGLRSALRATAGYPTADKSSGSKATRFRPFRLAV